MCINLDSSYVRRKSVKTTGRISRGSSTTSGWEFFATPLCPDWLWDPLNLLSNR